VSSIALDRTQKKEPDTMSLEHARPTDSALDRFYTRQEAVQFLRELGYPVSLVTINKKAAPSVGRGPKVDRWFGRRPLSTGRTWLGWIESLCRRSSDDAA
jgi:hypothetical protein